MKKIYTTLLSICLVSGISAQTTQSTNLTTLKSDKTGKKESTTPAHRALSVSGTVTPCDSGSTTLSVSGVCAYNWYSDSLGTNLLASNSDYTTPVLTSSTTYYLETEGPGPESAIPLPPHQTSYSSDIRGYWFTAPSNFLITGLSVPTDASTGNSNIAIVRFNSGPPPSFSSTTNDFALLGYWPSTTEDTVDVCIPIVAGDVIGVLGARNDVNSYASGPYVSNIGGNAVTLTRMGMQSPLSTTTPANLWQEPGGSISRVNLIYSTSTVSGVIEPVTVIVPQSVATNANVGICQGDSILLGGAYASTSGIYTDYLTTMYGCDSVVTVDLSVNPSYAYQDTFSVCQGDSLMVGNTYYSSPGVYGAYLQTTTGCDSTIFFNLEETIIDPTTNVSGITISANGSGSYQWVDCDNNYSSITGANGQTFTPTSNGNYAVIVSEGSCSDTSDCVAITTVGMDELFFGTTMHVSPNPTKEEVLVSFGIVQKEITVELRSVTGQLIRTLHFEDVDQAKIDISGASGNYFITVKNTNGQHVTHRIIKH